jgi:hypothetical protein
MIKGITFSERRNGIGHETYTDRHRFSIVDDLDNLSFAELRRVLLGDRQFWNSNVRVTLLLRALGAWEREVVLKNIYQMPEAQFANIGSPRCSARRRPARPASSARTRGPWSWRWPSRERWRS